MRLHIGRPDTPYNQANLRPLGMKGRGERGGGGRIGCRFSTRDQGERFPKNRPGAFPYRSNISSVFRRTGRKYYSVLHTLCSPPSTSPSPNFPSSLGPDHPLGRPSILSFFIFGGILAKNCRRNDIIARCRDQFPSTSSSLLHSTAVFYYVLYRIIAYPLPRAFTCLHLASPPRPRRVLSALPVNTAGVNSQEVIVISLRAAANRRDVLSVVFGW